MVNAENPQHFASINTLAAYIEANSPKGRRAWKKQEIFDELQAALVEDFELDAAEIVRRSRAPGRIWRLDSIDTVMSLIVQAPRRSLPAQCDRKVFQESAARCRMSLTAIYHMLHGNRGHDRRGGWKIDVARCFR